MLSQLILHFIGDYITQSHWMAKNKTKRFGPAAIHAIIYSLPFLLLGPSWIGFLVILVSHFWIDRYSTARSLVLIKNALGDPDFYRAWYATLVTSYGQDQEVYNANAAVFIGPVVDRYHTSTGYPSECPPCLATWLCIAADNTLHLAINYVALRWL